MTFAVFTTFTVSDLVATVPASILLFALHDYCKRRERALKLKQEYGTLQRTGK